MLNKSRLENLSDGVYAIVLTLLVFDIQLPESADVLSNQALLNTLKSVSPTFVEFLLSFLVLTMFWISHNFFYSHFAKTINRQIILLNLIYLGLVSLIPFSARVLGTYFGVPLAADVYGLNVFLVGLVNAVIFVYAFKSDEVETHEIDSRLLKQARIRSYLTIGSAALGMAVAWISFSVALLFFVLPLIFNILPGSLNAIEKIFRFELT